MNEPKAITDEELAEMKSLHSKDDAFTGRLRCIAEIKRQRTEIERLQLLDRTEYETSVNCNDAVIAAIDDWLTSHTPSSDRHRLKADKKKKH